MLSVFSQVFGLSLAEKAKLLEFALGDYWHEANTWKLWARYNLIGWPMYAPQFFEQIAPTRKLLTDSKPKSIFALFHQTFMKFDLINYTNSGLLTLFLTILVDAFSL